MLCKALWFEYPRGWFAREVVLLVTCPVAHRLRHVLGSYGNRTKNSASLAAFLALTTPMVLGVGYFTCMQVYVLNLEFVLGVFSLSLLAGQLLFSAAAGMAFYLRKRDLFMVVCGTGVALVSLVMVLVITGIGTFGREEWAAIYVVSLNLIWVSAIVAGVACVLMLQLDL